MIQMLFTVTNLILIPESLTIQSSTKAHEDYFSTTRHPAAKGKSVCSSIHLVLCCGCDGDTLNKGRSHLTTYKLHKVHISPRESGVK